MTKTGAEAAPKRAGRVNPMNAASVMLPLITPAILIVASPPYTTPLIARAGLPSL